MLEFIIWNGSPEIFSFNIPGIGPFALRWYGLLFALGFLVSQQILYYMYRKEGKPEKDVDTLTIYMIVATIIGARLGHVIFYQPEIIWESPLSVFLPFEFNPFKFTGFQGLASHGGAFGILFALWLYSRKKKANQNYLQVLDRIVILVCITGCFIRLGNFFNSEIIGKPSSNPLGVVFVNRISESIMSRNSNDMPSPAEYVQIKKSDLPPGQNSRMPIDITILFKRGLDEGQARNFLNNDVKYYLTRLDEFVDEPASTPLNYRLVKEDNLLYSAKVQTFGIARHPAQLYESISCFILFAFLLWYWSKYKINLPEGRIFGIFMIALWTLRFLYEFLKENQVDFENQMKLNMGQVLSVPLIIVGIWVLVRSYKKPATEIGGTP